MEKTKKFCTNCGAEIDIRAELCPSCGVRQTLAPTQQVESKKGFPKWAIAVVIIIALGVIGNMMGSNTGNGIGSSSSTTPYKWVELQSINYDTEEEYFDFIMTKVYETFEIPNNCVEWKAEVTWRGGDKDSYIKLTFWRYGETDDVNIGHIYENSKQGSTTFTYKDIHKGKLYYVEASMINNLDGIIKVYAKVPG